MSKFELATKASKQKEQIFILFFFFYLFYKQCVRNDVMYRKICS